MKNFVISLFVDVLLTIILTCFVFSQKNQNLFTNHPLKPESVMGGKHGNLTSLFEEKERCDDEDSLDVSERLIDLAPIFWTTS
jgi:hypothetical protein